MKTIYIHFSDTNPYVNFVIATLATVWFALAIVIEHKNSHSRGGI